MATGKMELTGDRARAPAPMLPHCCRHPGCGERTFFAYCVGHFTQHGEFSKITIVCGPPGSGKTTYVQERSAAGDLILDVDALHNALSGMPFHQKHDVLLPFVLHAYQAILMHLQKETADVSQIGHAWVIKGGARREERDKLRWRFHSEVILLATPADVCLERIEKQNRPGRKDWPGLVTEWWNLYEPSAEDRVVSL